jgi:hypothetical protein
MKEKAIFTTAIAVLLFLVFSLFSSLNKDKQPSITEETIDLNIESDTSVKVYQNDYKKINKSDLETQKEAINRFKKIRKRRARINRNSGRSTADINRRLKELQEEAARKKKDSNASNPNNTKEDEKKEKALTEEEKKKKEEAEKKKKEENAKKQEEERARKERQDKIDRSLETKDSMISSLNAKRPSQPSVFIADQNSIINELDIEDETDEEEASSSESVNSTLTSVETIDSSASSENSTEIAALIQERNSEDLLELLESSSLSTFKRNSLNSLVKSVAVTENIAFITPIVTSSYLNVNNLGLFTNSMIVDDYSFEERSFMASLIMQSLDGSAKLLSRNDYVELYFNGVKAQLSNTSKESNSSILDLYSELDMKIDETYELLDSETEVASN